jgi:hypothetical protein
MTNHATIAQPTPILKKDRVPKADAITYAQTRLFLEMGRVEKAVFLLKLAIFLSSFGFAFPRLLSDGCEGKEY